MKILLFYIEEDECIRSSLEHFLAKRFDLITSGSEEEAITQYSRKHKEIDIVIVDFMMQHGIRLIKEIEMIKPTQKIITLSGSPVCSSETGCSYCAENLNRKRIMKPVNLHELLDAVSDFENTPCQLRGECDVPDFAHNSYLF